VKKFFYRNIYLPKKGMFCQLPKDLSLGQRLPVSALTLLPQPATLLHPCASQHAERRPFCLPT
jgi:hypothetical protein